MLYRYYCMECSNFSLALRIPSKFLAPKRGCSCIPGGVGTVPGINRGFNPFTPLRKSWHAHQFQAVFPLPTPASAPTPNMSGRHVKRGKIVRCQGQRAERSTLKPSILVSVKACQKAKVAVCQRDGNLCPTLFGMHQICTYARTGTIPYKKINRWVRAGVRDRF